MRQTGGHCANVGTGRICKYIITACGAVYLHRWLAASRPQRARAYGLYGLIVCLRTSIVNVPGMGQLLTDFRRLPNLIVFSL